MRQQLSLDDRLKRAQVERTLAEIGKLRRETDAVELQMEKTRAEARKTLSEAAAVDRNIRGAEWTEPLKLLAAVILGIGGAVAAFTQYEVAELRAKQANGETMKAEAAAASAGGRG